MMRWMFLIPALLATAIVAAEEPDDIIRDTTNRVIELVENNRSLYENNHDRLRADVREVLMPHIDSVYTARLVLGRHGRELERAQVEEFAETLSDQLLRRYSSALLDYELRDRLEILPMTGENTERMTRVRTRIQIDSTNRAPMDYVFRKSGGKWMVFDVIVEGISYVATFRNQVNDEIRKHGFDGLMQRLRRGEIEFEVDESE